VAAGSPRNAPSPAPVRPGARRSRFYKLLAVLLAAGFAVGLMLLATGRESSGDDAPGEGATTAGDPAATEAASTTSPASRDAVAAARAHANAVSAQDAPARDDPNDLASLYVPGQPPPTAKQVIDGLHAAGIQSGLGAFQPPGTSPPLIGIAVPEDYALPAGFVRHYQATDDGQRIEPILMFSPDFEFYDAAGRRIEVPDDRVVPAELAPPGLPIRAIAIPPPLPPAGPST
jgi:hypothetical protein